MLVEPRITKPSSFWGQGVLILLPVVLLTVAGLLSLRKDRLLVEAEARDRASDLAGRLAEKAAQELSQPSAGTRGGWLGTQLQSRIDAEALLALPGLTPSRQELAFRLRRFSPIDPRTVRIFGVNTDGRLSQPPPRPPVPVPQAFAEAEVEQLARQWRQALDPVDVAFPEAFSRLTAASRDQGWSRQLITVGMFRLARLLEDEHQWIAAHQLYWNLQQDDTSVLSTGGLPMGQLALARLTPLVMQHVELARRDPLRQYFSSGLPGPTANQRVLHALIHRLCEVAVLYPSTISERLLDLGETWEQQLFPQGPPLIPVRDWRQVWLADEATRLFYQDWRRDPPANPAQSSNARWVHSDAQNWLVLGLDSSGGDQRFYLAQSEPRVAEVFLRLESESRFSGSIPPYFGIVFEVAGRPMPGGSGARAETILAQSAEGAGAVGGSREGEVAPVPLRVGIYLTDPALLYANQRQRSRWFGLLILMAAAVAVVGFGSAYRAYRRQLQLSRMKSNFVSSVSHELRAPIASIRLMAEGLGAGPGG